jgi:hypothetical protein
MSTAKSMFIRGARIEQQLIAETSIATLNQNTLSFQPPSNRRQHVVAPIQVKSLLMIPMRGQRDTGDLKIEARVQSGPKQYDCTIMFHDVIYEDQDRPDNISFLGPDKTEAHIVPIQLARNNAEVRCTCLDFYFTFSKWNQSDRSLYGDPPPQYTPRTNRAERNPTHKPGLCKHLMKVVQELRNEQVVR